MQPQYQIKFIRKYMKVHEFLYHKDLTLTFINLTHRNTCKNIAATYASESVKVALDLVLPSVSLVQGVLGFI